MKLRIVITFIIFFLGLSALPNITLAAINILDIKAELISEKTVEISWRTDADTAGKVLFGKSKDDLPSFIIDQKAPATSHKIQIGNLESDAKYYYQIVAQGSEGTVYSFINSFETEEFDDTKAPHVTDQKLAWLAGTVAVFTWNTDEAADSTVEYGTDNNYSKKTSGRGRVTEHVVTLKNLIRDTRYYARLKSDDKDGNSSGYFHFEFKTLSSDKAENEDLKISNLRPSGSSDSHISNTLIVVSFNSNHLAKGSITLTGLGVGRVTTTLGYNTEHEVKFIGLTPESNYSISIYLDDVLGKRMSRNFEVATLRQAPVSPVDGVVSAVASKKTTLTCSADIFKGTGYYGQYYNQSEDIRYPLNMEALETGYYDASKLEQIQIDGKLAFPRNFNGLGVKSNGQPFHFNTYWRGLLAVLSNRDYSYNLRSDDNAWVYINGELNSSLDALKIQLDSPKSNYLQRGLYLVEIYYSHRGRSGSEFTFDPGSDIRMFPLPIGCSALDASKFIPGNNFDALFNINNSHPDALNGSSGGNANGGGLTPAVSGGTDNLGLKPITIGGGDSNVVVLGVSFSLYSSAAALYRIKGAPDIYALVNGQLHYISSPASFNEYGYSWADIKTVNSDSLLKYPRARLIKSPNNSTVYFLYQRPEGQWLKININSPTVFVSYPSNYWGNVITVTQLDVDSYPDVRLIKTIDNNTVYFLDNEKATKHALKAEIFKRNGYNPHEIAIVNQIHMDSYLIGNPLK